MYVYFLRTDTDMTKEGIKYSSNSQGLNVHLEVESMHAKHFL